MRFTDVLGHPRPLAILRRALASGRIHHAWLFHGAEGVGKRTVAEAFAQALLCEAPGPDGGCERCPACAKVRAGTHPDLHRLDVPGERSRIPIEQFHALEAGLQMAAFEGRRRVALIDKADLLSREAQHAFLKTLEEPRPDTVLVLVTPRPSALLGTILSRCQRVAFGAIPPDVIARELVRRGNADAPRADLVAGIARGSLGRAIELAAANALADRDAAIEMADAAAQGILAPGLGWSEDFKGTAADRERVIRVLELLSLRARDVLVLASGGKAADLAHRDLADRSAREARVPGAALRAARAFARIAAARRDVIANVNPSLALQGLFVDLAAGTAAGPR
jgi:DNA polymerase-3 subunit delta'